MIIWISMLVLYLTITGELYALLKLILKRQILTIFLLIGVYLFLVVQFLIYIGAWREGSLKDGIFWLFSVGLISVFKVSDASSQDYFRRIFYSAIKWTVVLEFILNLYCFNLWIELLLVPMMIFLGASQAYAKGYYRNLAVSNLLNVFIALISFTAFGYSLFMTINNFNDVLTSRNLISFLLPSSITILFIPCLYFLALYMVYESYFTHLELKTRKNDKVKEVKKHILRVANFNLDKLTRIKKNFDKRVFYDETDLRSYIREISRKN